jgi:hypothetical protein
MKEKEDGGYPTDDGSHAANECVAFVVVHRFERSLIDRRDHFFVGFDAVPSRRLESL